MSSGKRFSTINEERLRSLDQARDSYNTKRVVNRGANLLTEFLRENGLELSDIVENPAELNNQLRYFYASVRQKNGEELKKKSMDSLKYGISKYLLDKYRINLKDQQFLSSNETYKSKVKQLTRSGHAKVEHKSVISDCDLQKLNDAAVPFNINCPCGLQNKVWFNVMYYLIRRGQENLRTMTKSTFAVGTDSSGRKFVHQVIGEATKNHGVDDSPDDTTGEGKIYEQPGSPFCPVQCFQKYLSKLSPKIDALWQRPLDSYIETSDIWYCAAPLGKNALGGMMAKISRQAELSKVYTNHCLRATAITKLDTCGFEARHIMRASGHKSESSIRSYSTRLSEEQQRNMSDCLSKPLANRKETNALNDLSEQDLLEVFSNVNVFEEIIASGDSNSVPVPQACQQTEPKGTGAVATVQNQVIQQSFNRLTDINRNAPQFNFSSCQVHFHYN